MFFIVAKKSAKKLFSSGKNLKVKVIIDSQFTYLRVFEVLRVQAMSWNFLKKEMKAQISLSGKLLCLWQTSNLSRNSTHVELIKLFISFY